MDASSDHIPPPPDVSGTSLDGSKPYIISSTENAALCRSVGIAPATDGTAHPIYHFIATQIGMRFSVEQFCKLFEFDIADGPMIIGSAVIFHTPLRTETPYMVRGEILSVTRKLSRKLGVMDIGEYQLSLVTTNEVAAVVTNSWVFPRKAKT